jgi:coatomer subunit beta'
VHLERFIRGHFPAEYFGQGLITKEYDIFSLGVMVVELMIGHEGYFKMYHLGSEGFIKHVYDSWRKRLCQTLAPKSLEVYCEQVKICVQIAVKCIKHDRKERPTLQSIVSNLTETETETMVGDLGMHTEQFQNGESVQPEGGIQATAPG